MLAASGDDRRLGGPGRGELVAAADAAGGEPAAHAHVATGDGEVFCVRHGDLVGGRGRRALRPRLADDLRPARGAARARPGGLRCRRSRTGSCSTASRATRTRRPPTCAGAATCASRSPGVYYPGGRCAGFSAETEEGKALFVAAAHVIEVAGPPRRAARQARTGTPAGSGSAADAGLAPFLAS